MLKVTTAGKDLLYSTTFMVLGLGETEIVVDDVESLRFILEFVRDEDAGELKGFEWVPIDKQTLRVRILVSKRHLAATLFEPTLVGTFSQRELFVMFGLKKLGKEGDFRELTFSLYLGKQVTDGQL